MTTSSESKGQGRGLRDRGKPRCERDRLERAYEDVRGLITVHKGPGLVWGSLQEVLRRSWARVVTSDTGIAQDIRVVWEPQLAGILLVSLSSHVTFQFHRPRSRIY